jgi:hypothetical protein
VGAAGGGLLLAGLFAAQLAVFTDPHTWYHGSWPGEQQDQAMQGFSNLVERTPGDIYSEDDYLILHNGRQVIYDDPSTFPLLAQAGRWDDSLFVQSLRDRRFALVFLWPGSGRLTSAERRIFDENYELAYAGSLDTYLPKLIPDTPQYPLACRLALGTDTIQLDGYSLSPGVAEHGVRPGEVLRVAVNWQAAAPVQGSYASFVHLVDANGQMLAGRDEPATGTGQPTSAWSPVKPAIDDLAVPVPADAAPGRYRLVVGMYANDGGKLTALVPTCPDPGQLYGDAIAPGSVEIIQP